MPTTFSRLELTFNIQLTTKVHTLDCNTRCIIGNLLIIAQLHHALLIIKAQVFSYTSNALCCKQVAMLQKVYYLVVYGLDFQVLLFDGAQHRT
jgi:hypothetical protein